MNINTDGKSEVNVTGGSVLNTDGTSSVQVGREGSGGHVQGQGAIVAMHLDDTAIAALEERERMLGKAAGTSDTTGRSDPSRGSVIGRVRVQERGTGDSLYLRKDKK